MTTEPIATPAENAMARIDAATANGLVDDIAAGSEPASSPATDAPVDDDDLLATIPDDISYRDAARLRQEMRDQRSKYKPLESAFGEFSDEDRQALIEIAPALGSDLATTAQVFADLNPSDRQAFLAMADAWVNDRQRAIQMFGETARALGAEGLGGAPATAPASPAGATPAAPAPSSEVMTRAEFAAEMQQWQAEQQRAAFEAQARQDLHATAVKYGYNPDSNDPTERAMTGMFWQLGVEYGGNLERAHETMQALKEWTVAEYLDAKRADATRTAPVMAGSGPAPDGRAELATMDDAKSSALNRLEAVFGPDPVAALRGR